MSPTTSTEQNQLPSLDTADALTPRDLTAAEGARCITGREIIPPEICPHWTGNTKPPREGKFYYDEVKYPDTPVGELAALYLEHFNRLFDAPRPTSRQIAYTAHLTDLLGRDLRSSPLHDRDPLELELMNSLISPRNLWPSVRPCQIAITALIGESFLESLDQTARVFKHSWRAGHDHPALVPLQHLAINLAFFEGMDEPIGHMVDKIIPPNRTFQIMPAAVPGAVALLSLGRETGSRHATHMLAGGAVNTLLAAEKDGHAVDPIFRSSESMLVAWFLSDLLGARLLRLKRTDSSKWVPLPGEALDITSALLEGSHAPAHNYAAHVKMLGDPDRNALCEKLYHTRGVRNFLRLGLPEADNVWALAEELIKQDSCMKPGADVIMVAAGSADHNGAYLERGWDLEQLRQQGESDGWVLDFVEVRDSAELGLHILRHRDQGRKIAVLHWFAHGCKKTSGFGNVNRVQRNEFHMKKLLQNPDDREVCEAIAANVDTMVLHSCSSADRFDGTKPKASNLSEAIWTATGKQTSVVGLTDNDAFKSLRHRRGGNGKILFTAPAYYEGRRTLRGLKTMERRSSAFAQRFGGTSQTCCVDDLADCDTIDTA